MKTYFGLTIACAVVIALPAQAQDGNELRENARQALWWTDPIQMGKFLIDSLTRAAESPAGEALKEAGREYVMGHVRSATKVAEAAQAVAESPATETVNDVVHGFAMGYARTGAKVAEAAQKAGATLSAMGKVQKIAMDLAASRIRDHMREESAKRAAARQRKPGVRQALDEMGQN